MPRAVVREIIDICHDHDVRISTGGFIEHVLPLGPDSVYPYTGECHELRFEIVEISSGFITIPTDDWLRLIEQVQHQEMKAKPQVGIQFGTGGATAAAELAAEGTARSAMGDRAS